MKSLIEQGLAFTRDKGFTDKYMFGTIAGCKATESACLCCMQKHTHWWVDRQGALGAARELVGTNLHLQGAKLDAYLNENFPVMWDKYEVIGNGWIEVERMALFYKDLLKDYTISIQ